MTSRLISRFFSSGKIAVCSNGAVACWHPRTDIPFEHTKPIDLALKRHELQRRGIAGKQGPNNAELKDIFYTDKNEWFTRFVGTLLSFSPDCSELGKTDYAVSQLLFPKSRISYAEGLRQQEKYVNIAKSTKNANYPQNFLLTLEHFPVYTVGIRSKYYTTKEEERLKQLGADFHRTSRGGLITFHGPGQLVMYPIFHLLRIAPKSIGVRVYVEMLEQAIINCATDAFSISDVGRTENTGVWVEKSRKLAALGVAVSHGVTYHGLALNCNTDLSWFDHITACGLEGAKSTSLSKESQRDVSPSDALLPMLNSFSSVFQCSYNH